MGNLVWSAFPGVCMAVRGGGHEWVISWRETQSTELETQTHGLTAARSVFGQARVGTAGWEESVAVAAAA